ncbi:MAG: M43 family zinc metalloprotease [Salibacter sp.]|uniref:M43 family zinc metalloprotease n=1 Tax=Salibacter sp. TaxID=2010995 RepID=UPI00287046CF|nr:M43 family zinc metalloprotease [Salibacter sp.]MDR9397627.1 M43 family zinc metalloprotease [Salibacter sp.]
MAFLSSKKLVLTLSAIAISLTQFAQQPCGMNHAEQQLLQQNPSSSPIIESAQKELENFTQNYISSRATSNNKIVIPVVFHVVHQNGSENISEAQIKDAMRQINEDFSKSNADLSNVVPAFEGRIGDANFEFRLARKDPNGNSTNGIDRIVSSATNVGDQTAKINQWPPQKYLNIWTVANINFGAAAYALLPSVAAGNPSQDGIVSEHTYVGTIGTAAGGDGHTLPHEIGHFFNLEHPWGQSNSPGQTQNCGDDDFVQDTPNTVGTFGSCNTTQVSCGSLDNVQNIMDYSNCPVMFTEGQIDRMRAAANSGVAGRNNLWSQQNLNETGVGQLYSADFSAENATICLGDSLRLLDGSEYDPTSWNWNLSGSLQSTSNNKNPVVFYPEVGVYDVLLTSFQNGNQKSELKDGFVMVNNPVGRSMPYTEDFENVSQTPNIKWYTSDNNSNFGFELDETNGKQGGACLKMTNYSNSNDKPYKAISETVDLSVYDQFDLSFDLAYAMQSGGSGQDRLKIYISGDCGETWTEVFNEIGPFIQSASGVNGAFTPSSQSDWRAFSIDNLGAPLNGNNARIKIEFEAEGNNNLYIDNVNITGDWNDTPSLVYPFNGQTKLPSDFTFQWQPTGESISEYEFQYSDNIAFNNPVSTTKQKISVDPDNPDTEYDVTGLDPNATYFWRVRYVTNGNPGPWSDVWEFTISETGVGFEESLKEKYHFTVFPNPVESQINVRLLNNEDKPAEFSIYSMTGQRVFFSKQTISTGENVVQLNVDQLSGGVYLLETTIGSERITERVVVR